MKVYRKLEGSMIGGICSGLSDSFKIDVLVVRLLVVLGLVFTAGLVGIAYVIMWAVVPAIDSNTTIKEEFLWRVNSLKGEGKMSNNYLIGGGLIVLGCLVFLVFVFPFAILYKIILPFAFIGLGIYFLTKKK